VTLITFGYTNCPDICPMTLSILKHVMNQLGDGQEDVQVFFITIDPENDTPQKLKAYITFFHPSFLGLTGRKEEIVKVADSFKSHYPNDNQNAKTNHLKSHTFSIYLVNKEGSLLLTYPPDRLNPRAIARDIRKVAE
jgi:protein SCO1/2